MTGFFQEEIIEEKDAAPSQSTDEGSKSFRVPTTSWTVNNRLLNRCTGCPQYAAHAITTGFQPVIGDAEQRYDEIPTNIRLTPEELDRIQAALWIPYFIAFDPFIPEDELIGAGDAENNPTFGVTYRIESRSGATLTLFGPNPKKLVAQVLSLNPDWLPDSEEPRKLSTARYFALPIGSQLKFLRPSVLENKQEPMVIGIDYPASDDDEVEFDVTVSSDELSNWDTPSDEDLEPDAYYCRILFELVTESNWGNFQSFPEATWSRRSMTFDSGTIAEVKALKGFTNNDVPVLPTDLLSNAVTVRVNRTSGTDVLNNVPVVVVKTGASTYSSTIDLTALDAVDLEAITVAYWCKDTEVGNDRKVRCPATCANDQFDPAVGSRRCMSPNCSGFANYAAGDCFQPGADKFVLGHLPGSMYREENLGLRITSPGGDWLGDWWMRSNYFLEQIIASSNPRAFRYKKDSSRNGPSVASLTGAYTDLVPIVKGTYQFEHQYGAFGKRITDPDAGHLHVTGGFWRAPYETDGPVFEWYDAEDVAGSLEAGCLAAAVTLADFGSVTDCFGDTQTTALQMEPGRNNGGWSVADGSRAPNDLARVNVLYENADATVAAANMNAEVDP